MSRWMKRIGIGLAVAAGLIAIAVGVLYAMSGVRIARKYDIAAGTIAIPSDPAAVAKGAHFANSVALCVDCHGGNLSGKMMIDDPVVGRIMAPNLTPAGRVAGYTDADWVRAIRHGVGRNGRPLVIMPSNMYANLSDEDLGALIAYLRQLPAAPGPDVKLRVGPLGRFAIVSNKLDALAAESIDHGAPRPAQAPADAPAQYGRYLASIGCTGCHGEQLRGKQDDFHDTPDITPQGRTAGWTREQFITTLRTGRRPDHTTLSPARMPWPLVGQMTDEELGSIYEYLRQLDRKVALQGIVP